MNLQPTNIERLGTLPSNSLCLKQMAMWIVRLMSELKVGCWGLLFLLGGCIPLYGQVDSLQLDTLEAEMGRPELPPRIDSISTPYFPPADSTNRSSNSQPKPWKAKLNQQWRAIRPKVPHTYTIEDTVKLALRVPWRPDSLSITVPDIFLPTEKPPPYNASVAWQRSFIIPGWGQAYNRSLWKVPFFYAGYIGIYGWLTYNQQQYLRYRSAFICAELNESNCTIPDDIGGVGDRSGIRTQRDNFRNARDNAILILAGWHVIQVAEAFVHAHLRDFDVSDDLTWHLGPRPIQTGPAFGLGMGIQLTW